LSSSAVDDATGAPAVPLRAAHDGFPDAGAGAGAGAAAGDAAAEPPPLVAEAPLLRCDQGIGLVASAGVDEGAGAGAGAGDGEEALPLPPPAIFNFQAGMGLPEASVAGGEVVDGLAVSVDATAGLKALAAGDTAVLVTASEDGFDPAGLGGKALAPPLLLAEPLPPPPLPADGVHTFPPLPKPGRDDVDADGDAMGGSLGAEGGAGGAGGGAGGRGAGTARGGGEGGREVESTPSAPLAAPGGGGGGASLALPLLRGGGGPDGGATSGRRRCRGGDRGPPATSGRRGWCRRSIRRWWGRRRGWRCRVDSVSLLGGRGVRGHGRWRWACATVQRSGWGSVRACVMDATRYLVPVPNLMVAGGARGGNGGPGLGSEGLGGERQRHPRCAATP